MQSNGKGNPMVSPLWKLTYGLYLLSARDEERDNACIVNAVQQVGDQPVTLAVSVNKRNLTHDMILKTGALNVSVLSEDVPFSIFQRFGMQSGKTADKFSGDCAIVRGTNGIVFLKDYANAYLSCKVKQSVDCGSHSLFLAEVTDSLVKTEVPSVTYSDYQQRIKPHPVTRTTHYAWVCTICGFVYEGENLPADFLCPLCQHDASFFERR